jgi:hypothetical protein
VEEEGRGLARAEGEMKEARMARERRPDRERRLAGSADPAKNLAAARFFYGYLAEEGRRFNAREEPQQYFMGACINFATGAVEALSVKVGVRNAGDEDAVWRGQQRPDDLALFDRLRDVRIEDFHFGVLDTKPGHRWVNAATIPGVTVFPGPPDAFVEERNPSGEVVRARALAQIQRLYIEHDGKQIDATEACRRFIALVESLVTSTSLAPPTKAT